MSVDPRGKCVSWDEKVEPSMPTDPRHAHLIQAIALLLRGYPAIWHEQADTIAKVLKATQKSNPPWDHLACRIKSLRQWVPKDKRRAFCAACKKAGAF